MFFQMPKSRTSAPDARSVARSHSPTKKRTTRTTRTTRFRSKKQRSRVASSSPLSPPPPSQIHPPIFGVADSDSDYQDSPPQKRSTSALLSDIHEWKSSQLGTSARDSTAKSLFRSLDSLPLASSSVPSISISYAQQETNAGLKRSHGLRTVKPGKEKRKVSIYNYYMLLFLI